MDDHDLPLLSSDHDAETRRAAPTEAKQDAVVNPPPKPAPQNTAPSSPAPRPAAKPASVPPAPVSARLRQKRDDPLRFPLWSIALMLLCVAVSAFSVVMVVVSLGAPGAPPATPQIMILTAPPLASSTPLNAPTSMSVFVQTPSGSTAFGLAGPTLPVVEISPTPQPISVGVTVRVNLPQNELNVRSAPGIENQLLFQAAHGRQFRVIDGPQSVGSILWWQIEDPFDPTQRGWAAGLYLEVVTQSP